MRNIIFDLGGVLIKGSSLSVLEKLNISNEDLNELKRFFDHRVELDLGKVTLEERFNECNFSSEIESKYKDILLNYYKYREINTDLIDLIKKLKDNNYNVYILSNNIKESFNYYMSNPLFNNIDGFICSCDYGLLKDDGKLFEVILDKYNLNPNECYFIDNTKLNIDMALKYNIKGYQFNEDEDIKYLYEDMNKNGIVI